MPVQGNGVNALTGLGKFCAGRGEGALHGRAIFDLGGGFAHPKRTGQLAWPSRRGIG
jgi:hypothetical protein